MRKFIATVTAGLLLLASGVCSAEFVGDLEEHLDDAGCEFQRAGSPSGAFPVFFSSFQEAWMKLDGEVTVLKQVVTRKNKRVSFYQAGVYKVAVDLGKKSKTDEAYPNVTITVRKKGARKVVVKAQGWCGCGG